jgi:hypothetical protein
MDLSYRVSYRYLGQVLNEIRFFAVYFNTAQQSFNALGLVLIQSFQVGAQLSAAKTGIVPSNCHAWKQLTRTLASKLEFMVNNAVACCRSLCHIH